MNDEWDGKTERRTNDNRIRDLEEKDRAKGLVLANLDKSLCAVHRRFTQFDHEQKAEIRIAAEEITQAFEKYAVKTDDRIKELGERITAYDVLKKQAISFYKGAKWVVGGLMGAGGIAGFIYKLVHHSDKIVK